MPRLRRADCSAPGITRRGRGRGFEYLTEDDTPLKDEAALERIRELAIPPAWREVWVCTHPMGHLQATGIDAAGRKQYVYHPRWRERRDQQKYEQMTDFARTLPALRRRVARDLKGDELTRTRVLACATRLLDLGFFRIGSEDYAEENESYGLATMRKEHVRLDGGEIVFDYIGKSGQRRVQAISDEPIEQVVERLKARRGGGPELLAYKQDGRWQDVRSDDINEYVKGRSGGEFTAKAFRTWNATVLAAVALADRADSHSTKTSRKRAISAAVKDVAAYLGNTPAVCRASYIDPRVFDRFQSGWTINGVFDALGDHADLAHWSHRRKIEEAVLDLIEDNRTELLEKAA